MRLGFLGDVNSPHVRRWVGWFLDRGHDVRLLVPAHDEIRVALDPRIGVQRFRAWPATRVRGVGSVITSITLRRALARVRPDVLHAHALTRFGFAAWLSGFHPYVVTVWGSDILVTLPSSRRRRTQGRLALSRADLVTAGSAHLRAAAIDAGARPERTAYVHFGVDTGRFAPGAASPGLQERLGVAGRRVVLSPRTIAPIYRQLVAVEALARLPDDRVLVLTRHRANPDELAAVERRATELGVANRVRIAPEIADGEMPDLYRLADVVVSVPASDGGPVTLVEALAAGRPVVATDLPSVREWLAEIDVDALVPVDDPAATAAAIERVLERSDTERRAYEERSRTLVLDRADWDTNMQRMESFYRGLAARTLGAAQIAASRT